MENIVMNKQEDPGIDLQKALVTLYRKSLLIIIASIVCAAAVFVATRLFVTPQYESSVMFYVNNSNLSLGSTSVSISSGDISASKSLVESYIVILNSRESLDEVTQEAQVQIPYEDLQKMITAAAVNDTEVFEVVVTSPDPAEAEVIANAIAVVLPRRISGIIENTSAQVVDHAVRAVKPSSPNYTINTIIGFMMGFILSVAVILMRQMFNTTIQSEEDVQEICAYPILATVPDMAATSKGAYAPGGKKKAVGDTAALVGGGVSFAAAEAYKLLRTKLQYSFTDEKSCRVIGVSSSLSGEGKSLTSINLAHTLSQMGKRVLLIDCDMRKPTMAEKLSIRNYPGLSGFLTGQSELREVIQPYSFTENDRKINVIAAGQYPPNPVELLSSVRMARFLEGLRNHYDYIILDLPPVGEVTDALAVARETDGILLVVRQNVCSRPALSDTIAQFEFVGAKLLGVVTNCVKEEGLGYRRKYYDRYEKNYYRAARVNEIMKARREKKESGADD